MKDVITQERAFFFLLLFLFVIGILIISPFLEAILLSIVFAVLFYPLHEKYLQWTSGRKNIASLLSTASFLIILIIPISILLHLTAVQLSHILVTQTQTQEPSLSESVFYFQKKMIVGAKKIESLLGMQFNLVPLIKERTHQLTQVFAKHILAIISGMANVALDFFVMMMLLFYFFRQGPEFLSKGIHLSPLKDRYGKKLTDEIKITIKGVFYGSFFVGFLQATFASIGYYFAHVENYLFWGIITFIASFLPTIGTALVIIPLSFALLFQGHVKHAIFLIAYGTLIVATLDNLLRPFLIHSHVHPVILLLGIVGGITLFGPLGLLLGPIIMATLIAALRIYAHDFSGVVSTS
ncbi:MAG: hypothetical protein A3I05_07665 [Deltaproteobacteria bacterium RIFCSPLOWO2_02_FULL_44_10]|nr:MAG: hypothetical protein A3C46_00130 [Deltaproteobacteria bacterium RIFCSPHIGHO2_02_FULL_44_16]OGQ46922.1 MAG: hypothetical protein A3I05_07665 [Deltaproteobacteria bacterium RIFCSPLOWO2_02_FULL_44_10]